jgi:hypothetical protein
MPRKHMGEWSGQFHTFPALPSEERAPIRIVHVIGGPQNRFGRCGIGKNFLLLPGMEPRSFSP